MPNRGSVEGTIDSLNDTYTIAQGYHDGTGTVDIASTEKEKITNSNIKDGVEILGVTGSFTDASTVSSGQTAAAAAQILENYSAWVDGAEVQGSMSNNGAVSGSITTKAQTVTVNAGYTSGGTVSIAQAEQNKIVAGNIKAGVVILGVTGTYSGDAVTTSSITVIPFITGKTYTAAQVVPAGKKYYSDTALTTEVGTLANDTATLKIESTYGIILISGTQYYVDIDDIGTDYIAQVAVSEIAYSTENNAAGGQTVTIGTVDPTYVAP